MTQRLYYTDSYTTEFTARIVERTTAGDHPAVVLDRTYFYPTGGGQPHDTGMIGGIPVLDVFTRESDHVIVHVLEHEVVSEIATCNIDWSRRFDHMQQHTGQHILTQAFVETAEAKTVGFHLSPTSVTIDLDQPGLAPDVLDTVENLVNRVLQENRPVTARVVDPDEAEQLGARIRRIPGHLATDGLRVVEVENFDLTACGGTHVSRTGEIALIKVLKVENYKGGSRIEFACGGRALADYREKHTAISELATAFTTAPADVPTAVNRLRDDLKAAQSDLKRTRAALREMEAPSLLASATDQHGFRLISRVFEGRDPGDVRTLASTLTQQPGVIAVLAAAGEKAQVFCARSADLTHDMNHLLQTVLVQLNHARGGGRPDFAQGGGVPAAVPQLEQALHSAVQALMAQSQAG